jgi:hypothetical protein
MQFLWLITQEEIVELPAPRNTLRVNIATPDAFLSARYITYITDTAVAHTCNVTVTYLLLG